MNYGGIFMPSNPIQRKTRNAFLSGMLIMLLLAAAIIAVLYFTVFSDMFVGTTGTGGTVYAYRLISEIKSGEQIDPSKVERVKVAANNLPADYINETIDVTAYKSKINLQAGTILSASLLYSGEELADSTRLIEYNMLTLPSNLTVGDYIDVRFTMPSGQNYIVLSKKQVKNIQGTTVTLYLTEDEILMMSSAIIESYVMKASNLQAIKYVQAGIQESSTPTYSVNSDVYQLIMANYQKGINIEDYGKINDSYNSALRQTIEQELGQYVGTESTNIQEGIDKEKETAMELYLSGLEGY